MDKIYLAYHYKNIYKRNLEKNNIQDKIYKNILIAGYQGYIFGNIEYNVINYNTIDINLYRFFINNFISNPNVVILCESKLHEYYLSFNKYLNNILNIQIHFEIYTYNSAEDYWNNIKILSNKYNFDLILYKKINRRIKQRRPDFTFERANIPIGSKLICTLNNKEVTVYNNKKIIDETGKIFSLSGYITPIMRKKIKTERAHFSGITHFNYNGKKLNEIYDQILNII